MRYTIVWPTIQRYPQHSSPHLPQHSFLTRFRRLLRPIWLSRTLSALHGHLYGIPEESLTTLRPPPGSRLRMGQFPPEPVRVVRLTTDQWLLTALTLVASDLNVSNELTRRLPAPLLRSFVQCQT